MDGEDGSVLGGDVDGAAAEVLLGSLLAQFPLLQCLLAQHRRGILVVCISVVQELRDAASVGLLRLRLRVLNLRCGHVDFLGLVGEDGVLLVDTGGHG